MGKYVKDEWGKRGTYYVPPKNEPKEEPRFYAPGDEYDRLQRSNAYIDEVLTKKTADRQKFWKKNKVKEKPKRHWGLRILFFILIMFLLLISRNPNSSNTQMGNRSNIQQSQAGVKLNYHVKDMQFMSEQSDEAEIAIRDFCNLYQIEYSDLRYDLSVGGYILEVKNMGVFLTEDSVREKGQELQKSFETYCGAKGSTFGIQTITVEYGYTQVR